MKNKLVKFIIISIFFTGKSFTVETSAAGDANQVPQEQKDISYTSSKKNSPEAFSFTKKSPKSKETMQKNTPAKRHDTTQSTSDTLQGIILINKKTKMAPPVNTDIRGLVVVGLDIPGGAHSLNSYLESHYFNKPITQEKLLQLKQDLIRYFRKNNHPLVAMHIPSQPLQYGVIKIEVTESTFGEVRVVNCDWFSEKTLKNDILLKRGEIINEQELSKNVDFINRNTFRHVDLIYVSGKQPDTTDVELYVQDRFPFRIYSGLENTGTPLVERKRWYVGMNWGDALFLDQVLSYQFTGSWILSKFQAHTINWQIPLFHKHILSLYGGHSRVDTRVPIPPNALSNGDGESIQFSMRYTIPLNPSNYLLHEVYTGFDFKKTNTTVDLTDNNATYGNYVNIAQFVVGYDLTYDIPHFKTSYDIALFIEPGQWLPDQQNRKFNMLRLYAKNHYFYIRTSWTNIISIPYGFAMHLSFKGQVATQNLLPSEQMCVGGHDTVRGYEERELNGDNAFLTNFEFRFPSFKIINAPKSWKVSEGLQFLGFFDYGIVGSHKTVPGERPTRYLIGMGPGVRYIFDPYLTARLDVGFKIHNTQGLTGGSPMCHFMVTLGF